MHEEGSVLGEEVEYIGGGIKEQGQEQGRMNEVPQGAICMTLRGSALKCCILSTYLASTSPGPPIQEN